MGLWGGYSSFAAAPSIHQVCIQKKCFNVELADQDNSRQRGLMFRKSMPKNNGMLFVFPSTSYHAFWMKNTFIPLDLLWIDQDNIVVHIAPKATPHSEKLIYPSLPAKYVLEINGGMAAQYKFKLGNKVVFK